MSDYPEYVDKYPEHINEIQNLETEITRLRALVAVKDEALRTLANGEPMELSSGNARVALPSCYRAIARAALELEKE